MNPKIIALNMSMPSFLVHQAKHGLELSYRRKACPEVVEVELGFDLVDGPIRPPARPRSVQYNPRNAANAGLVVQVVKTNRFKLVFRNWHHGQSPDQRETISKPGSPPFGQQKVNCGNCRGKPGR